MGETQTGQVQTPEPKALTIPVNVTIEAAEVVLAQPEMEELLQGAELIAVGDCYCREAAGNCDRPLEVCLALNDEAQDNIDRNRWRAIGVAEALDILERTHRAGLVHHAFRRSNGSVNLICSCCSCCCEFLGSLTHLTYHGVQQRRLHPVWRLHQALPVRGVLARIGTGAGRLQRRPLLRLWPVRQHLPQRRDHVRRAFLREGSTGAALHPSAALMIGCPHRSTSGMGGVL